jgi:hypothetical protein
MKPLGLKISVCSMAHLFAVAADRSLACLASYRCSEEAAAASAESGSVCPICLNPFCVDDSLACLDCGHEHHHACLIEWLRLSATCPICKSAYALQADRRHSSARNFAHSTSDLPHQDGQDGPTAAAQVDMQLPAPVTSETEQGNDTFVVTGSTHLCPEQDPDRNDSEEG